MSKSLAPVTTTDLRSFLRSPEGKATFDALSPEAQATVVKGARGRLHPEARIAGPKAMGRKYVEATPKTVAVPVEHVQPSGRKVKVTKHVPEAAARKAMATAGIPVGQRGPIAKASLVAYGKTL